MDTLKLVIVPLAVMLTSMASASGIQQTFEAKGAAVKSKTEGRGFTSTPVKKGGSGVEVAYRIDGTPEVGRALTILLSVSSSSDAQLTLRGGEGIVLTGAVGPLQTLAGQTTLHQVSVMPTAQGRFYLHIVSSANGRDTASAIAIQVGKAAGQNKPSGDIQVMPNGERVISVPAR